MHKKNNYTKILFFSHDAYVYGASRSLVDLVDFLKANYPIEPVVVLPHKGPLENLLTVRKISYSILKIRRTVHSQNESLKVQFKNLLLNILKIRSNIKTIKQLNPDVVYINTSTFSFPSFYAYYFNIPLIIHLREFGDIDYRVKQDFNGMILKLVCKFSKTVIANSNSIQQYYYTKYNIQSEIIYNGIGHSNLYNERIQLRRDRYQNRKRENFNLAIVGIVRPEKGQFVALQALYQLIQNDTNYHLYIIGEGDIKPLENFIQTNALSKWVTLVGHSDSVEEYYLNMDAILVCSTNEAFGRVSIEAMSFGIPVIGLNSGGTGEIITHLETGLLFDGTYLDLAHKISELKSNRELYKRISFGGWMHAKNNFSLEVHGKKIYDKCIRPVITR